MKVESKSREMLKRLRTRNTKISNMPCIDYVAQFLEQINMLRYKYDVFTIFQDFLELSAIALANRLAMDTVYVKRETRYLEIAKRYSAEELSIFARLLSIVVAALNTKFQDILGMICAQLNLNNTWRGQFFTPYHLAQTSAQMIFDAKQLKRCIFHDRVLMIAEPACGSGCMVIAMLETIRKAGFNYQTSTYMECSDIDLRAVHMTYIQLTLFGAPACIFHRNTLSNETFDVWYTPSYWFGTMPYKIKRTLVFNQKQSAKEKLDAKRKRETTTSKKRPTRRTTRT